MPHKVIGPPYRVDDPQKHLLEERDGERGKGREGEGKREREGERV